MSVGRTQLFWAPEDRKRTDSLKTARSGAALLHVSTHAVADMDDPSVPACFFFA